MTRTPVTVEENAPFASAEPSSSYPRERFDLPARDRWFVMAGTTILYLGMMGVLAANDLLFTDAVSRVGNAYYALASRDPHLAAIGFVWNPLPSIVAMPLLTLAPLWRPLASLGLAGAIPVAVAGGLTAIPLHRALSDFGLRRGTALVLTLCFSLHPYLVLAASTGSSETLMMLWLMMIAAALVRWVRAGGTGQLVMAGLALSLAYLTRYEAIAAVMAAGVGVAITSAVRHRLERRWSYVAIDVALVTFPAAFAFAAWAFASKIIVGEWFATFSSAYGNTAQVAFASESIDASVTGPWGRLGYALMQSSSLEPVWVAVVAAAVVTAVRRTGLIAVVPLAVFGSVLAFQWLTLGMGGSFGWLRFQISVIGLTVLSAGGVIAAARHQLVVGTLTVIALCGALPSTAWALGHASIAREESIMTLSGRAGQHSMERDIASWLDALQLPDGAVVTDVAYSGPIVLASSNPRQFTITPDRDFPEALASPGSSGVRYALVTKPEVSEADAVAREYPGMYDDGAGRATLTREWSDQRGYTWRLYEFR